MTDDRLVADPEPDHFEHETPLRAFTDWNAGDTYAIGKGLRPSPQHLPVYLDAIEKKEGWQLVQMLLDDRGTFRSAIFRRLPLLVNGYPLDYMLATMAHETAKAPAPVKDDPVNPKHYGGTACAEIGERLTANCYQVLKYCWRLGEKDDPCIELGKAIWYAEREHMMGPPRSRGSAPLTGMKQAFVLERTEAAPWRREIAMMLWEMCYGFGTAPHWYSTMEELTKRLYAKREEMTPGCADRGRGLEP